MNSEQRIDSEESSKKSGEYLKSRNNSHVSFKEREIDNALDEVNNKPSDGYSSIFNYTSIYSNISGKENSSSDQKLFKIQEHIENKKKEKLIPLEEKDEVKEEEKSPEEDITLTSLTKDNFLNILNNMDYENISKLKNRLSEIGIYNQFNDVLFDKQNKIIEKLIEQKQELERKIQYQKDEIVKLRYSVECYDNKMKYIRKKTLNDICHRCGITFDKDGYPRRVAMFGKPITKEEIIEKTKIRSDLIEVGLGTKKEVKSEVNNSPLE